MSTEIELLITVTVQGDIEIDAKAAALHLAQVLSEREYSHSNACSAGILPLTNGDRSSVYLVVEGFTVDCDRNVATALGYHCGEVIYDWEDEEEEGGMGCEQCG